MNVDEFVGEVRPGTRISVSGDVFRVGQVVRWRMLRSGDCYHKYVLIDDKGDDGYRFAEDIESGRFILVHVVDSGVDELVNQVEVEGKKFDFSYSEFCVVEKVWGSGWYSEGDIETWLDYESEDGGYLSLGNSLPDGKREDLIGRWVEPNEVDVVRGEK